MQKECIKLEQEIQKDIVKNYTQADRVSAALKETRNTDIQEENIQSLSSQPDEDKQVGLLKPQKKKESKASCFAGLSSYVLMIALGVHSLFEGIALGLGSDLEQVTLLALAILMHKGAAGMALGTSLCKAFPDNDNHVVKLIFMFAIFTPIGILIGWAAGSSGSGVLEMVFNALAAGTFIYIGCSEVIVEEFATKENKWWKFLAYVCGILFITTLGFMEE